MRAWKFSPDGLTLTFTLRPGQTFSDGAPVDATAIRQNVERGKNQTGSQVAPSLAAIASVDAATPTEAVFHLSRQDYALPLVLGGRSGMIVSPRALAGDVKALATKPVGAGPFSLTSYVPDGQAELTRNPAYWDAANIHLAGVTLKFLSDPATIAAALQSDEIQLANYISPPQAKALTAAGLQVEEFRSLQISNLAINRTIKPFDNPKIVEALNHAVNRQELLDKLNAGHGEVVYQPFPRGYVGYNPSLENLYTHDPAKAKALLTEAGYDGTPVVISYFTSPGGVDREVEAQLLQAQFEAIGLTVKLEKIPFGQVAERFYVKREVGLLLSGTFGREAPAQQLATTATQYSSYDPAALTEALKNVARFPIDDPGYAPALQEATKIAATKGSDVLVFSQPWLLAHSKKLTGLVGYLTSPRLEGVRLAG
ncbi:MULTISPECIES: ABC transporter substrate-binding protein [unclassified Frankia]|uniref:ABC transporter substrate-binding protein n=1 Tax=unclassified Frankia TaxID=2632575 RepID=UPI0020247D7D